MAELADAHGSGPCEVTRVGSTPTCGTKGSELRIIYETKSQRSGYQRQLKSEGYF